MARTKDPFSILKMKDVFDDCSETLFASIRKQNPDANMDAFDMALRQLVMSYGSSPAYSGMNGIIASIQEPAPMYIEAADVLVLARKAFVEGDLEEALKLFALSNDSDNADDLYDALALNNSKSELGVIHAATVEADDSSEDEDEDSEDDESEENGSDDYSVDDDDTPLYDLRNSDDENGGDYDENSEDEDDSSEDEDDEDEDEEVESAARVIARAIRLHAEEDEVDNTSDDKTDTADDETEENEPNGGTSSGKFNANTGKPQTVESMDKARLQRIAANKMSLDGTDKSLARAGRLQLKKAS